MTSDIRLYIVTDNPELAATDIFALPAEFIPAWARIVTTPEGLVAIPTGARVMPSWHGRRSLLEQLWTEDRIIRSFRDGWDENRAAMADWRAKRHQRFLTECCDRPKGGDRPAVETVNPPAMRPAPATQKRSLWT